MRPAPGRGMMSIRLWRADQPHPPGAWIPYFYTASPRRLSAKLSASGAALNANQILLHDDDACLRVKRLKGIIGYMIAKV